MSLAYRTYVLRRIEEALGQTAGVSGAAYFGSIATGQVDRFSDIDLVVRCGPGAAELVVSALHARLDVVLYRPFTAVRKPSGRYWFNGANPFLRLDVSFHAEAVFDELVVHGLGYAQPPFAPIALADTSGGGPPVEPMPAWSEVDFEFAGALRGYHESAKATARGRLPRRPLAEVEAAVRGLQAAGLRSELWQLYERSVELLATRPAER